MTMLDRTVVRRVLGTTVLVAASSVVSAQTRTVPGPAPPPDDGETVVRRLLESSDPRAQAWGAWYAGRDQMRHFVPLVQAVVAQHMFGETLNENAATEIALDALIQMHAALPPQQLAPVYERRPAQALILASLTGRGDEDAEAFLLDVLSGKKYDDWFAAANILLDWRTPRLAGSIIRTLRITAHVYITRGDHRSGGGFTSGSAVGIGCGAGGAGATGLPPWAEYRLATSVQPGLVVLSNGPTAVYYQRIVARAGSAPARSVVDRFNPSADDRLRYLAALAGLQEDSLPLRGVEFREIRLPKDAPAAAAIENARADLGKQWSMLAQALVNNSALPGEEARTLLPVFDFVVHDSQ